MLELTHELQEALCRPVEGPTPHSALLIRDGDALYITQDRMDWMLVLPSLELCAPEHVVRVVNASNRPVDWRIWCAEDLDDAQQSFRPQGGRKFFPWYVSGWATSSHICRERIERYSAVLYADSTDLTALYAEGNAHVLYNKAKGDFNKEHAALHLVFQFDDRVLSVPAQAFAALAELGCQISCPKTCEENAPPMLGVYKDGEIPIFGFLSAGRTSGIVLTDDGRELYQDAAVVSWLSPESALEVLHGSKYARGVSIWDLVDNNLRSVRLAVSTLRWRGLSDAQISELYEAGRAASYQGQYAELLEEGDSKLGRISHLVNTNRYPLTDRVEEVARLLRDFSEYLGTELDCGAWSEIDRRLQESV